MSGEQELGITESKEHSPGEWYAEVVQKAGLADYAPGLCSFDSVMPSSCSPLIPYGAVARY